MPDLPPTDEQVLTAAASGYSAHTIARILGVEVKAVHRTTARIRRRLGASSLDHAVQIHQTRTEQPDAR
jgi:DNA-binding NarL/FixJ family response regulator